MYQCPHVSLIKVAATVAMFWAAVCVGLLSLSLPHTLDTLTIDTELTLDLEIEIEVADISDNVTSEGEGEPPIEAANEGILLNIEPVLAELDDDEQVTDLFETETITPHHLQSNDAEITIIATTTSGTVGNDNNISLDGNSFVANTSKNGSNNLTAEEYIPNNNNRSATDESRTSNNSATDMDPNLSSKVNASQDHTEQASISNASVTNNSSNNNIISNIMSTATVNNPNNTVNNSLDDDDVETRRGKYNNISLVQLVFFILLLVILG